MFVSVCAVLQYITSSHLGNAIVAGSLRDCKWTSANVEERLDRGEAEELLRDFKGRASSLLVRRSDARIIKHSTAAPPPRLAQLQPSGSSGSCIPFVLGVVSADSSFGGGHRVAPAADSDSFGVWRATVGDNGAMTITHLLSQQSYLVQVSLVVATALVIGALLYSFATALPGMLLKLTTRNERQKQDEYRKAQEQLGNTQTLATPVRRGFGSYGKTR